MSETVATTLLLALTAVVVGTVSLGAFGAAHLARVTRIAETLAGVVASRERPAPGPILDWPAPRARVPPFARKDSVPP